MCELVIVPTRREYVGQLADVMRADDVEEVRNMGSSPRKMLWRSYRRSVFSRTAFVDGEIAAIWGMGGSALGPVGRPWLLTSAAVERVPLSVAKVGRGEVAKMLAICPKLVGFVDDNYVRAVRLLILLGFELSAPFPMGPYQLPFRRYEMRRPE